LISTVLFKFRPEVTQEHKDTFVREIKKLKDLDCVKGQRLVVGGPSLTQPIERSKGFQIALLSFHENLAELEKYQASKEHSWCVGTAIWSFLRAFRTLTSACKRRVTSTYMFPYKEDLVRFDFEVAPEDQWMWHFLPLHGVNGERKDE
jgi:hypothetical protein